MEMFGDYCSPRTNEVFERWRFFSCSQQEGQPVDSYLTELKTLASTCNFGEQEEGLIRDRLVLGIREGALLQRLLREPDLTLQKATNFLRSVEASQSQIEALQSSSQVHEVRRGGTTSRERVTCEKCGYTHKTWNCPALGKFCAKCGGKNHFAAVCKAKVGGRKRVDDIVETGGAGKLQQTRGAELYIDSVDKESLLVSAGVLLCMLEAACSMGTYYTYYPDNAGAYQLQPYSPYAPYYAPYAFPAPLADCDKKKEEGSSSSSSESSSSSSESSEGESKEEGGESKEEGESGSSSEEGESKEEGSSSEEGESKEEGKEEKKEKKEKKEEKEEGSLFPPRVQYIYSAPVAYPYNAAPFKSYTVVQQQPMRASYPYYAYSAPTARVVSSPVSKIISPSAYSVPTMGKSVGYAPSGAYWAPSANMAYYKA